MAEPARPLAIPPPLSPGRFRDLGEKVEIYGAESHSDNVDKDEHKGDEHRQGKDRHEEGHCRALSLAPGEAGHIVLPAFSPRVTLQIRSLARILMIRVTTRRMRPISISAAACRFEDASANSLAMTLGMV